MSESSLPVSIYQHLKQPGRRVMALDGVVQPGRFYQVNEKLGDPAGFIFAASNTLGVFEIGDRVPLYSTTKLTAHASGDNVWKLVCDGQTVAEAQGVRIEHVVKEPGACRAQVYRGEQLWIETEPIILERPAPETLRLPPSTLDASVEGHRNIEYTTGDPAAAAKHQLDIYAPRERGHQLAPVFLFLHGGTWRSGDRALYPAFGNRFAKHGAVVVVPSYRLAPAYKHPAQMEDVAAAVAWTVKIIERFGGDPRRIYLGGHSAGGHLAALLALDPRYLAAHQLEPSLLGGVIAMSGVYQVVNQEHVFGSDPEAWKQASPQTFIRPDAPPFVITWCQWDYATLPAQARQFHAALRQAGARSTLVYVPGQNHISEIIHAVTGGDVTAQSVLRLIGLGASKTVNESPPQSGGSK